MTRVLLLERPMCFGSLKSNLIERCCPYRIVVNSSVRISIDLPDQCTACNTRSYQWGSRVDEIEVTTERAYTLSPLIIYSPSGTISTPSSSENSLSTLSARMIFARASHPINLPYCNNCQDTCGKSRRFRPTTMTLPSYRITCTCSGGNQEGCQHAWKGCHEIRNVCSEPRLTIHE